MLYGHDIRYVKKRDGSVELFDKSKITKTLSDVFTRVDGTITRDSQMLVNEITQFINYITDSGTPTAKIQTMIEDSLMDSHRKDVARIFIISGYLKHIQQVIRPSEVLT